MRLPQRPPASFYVNAHHWQDDIARVVDRVDHFVVHLSSLTEGSLWEIALLRDRRRQPDSTIVFDPAAVQRRGFSAGFDSSLAARSPEPALAGGREARSEHDC